MGASPIPQRFYPPPVSLLLALASVCIILSRPLFASAEPTTQTKPIDDLCAVQSSKPDTVLITGGTGMIGSQLLISALEDRHCLFGKSSRIVALVRFRSNFRNLAGYIGRPNLKLVYGDVTDAPFLMNLVEELDPDYIFHLAAQAINGVSSQVPSLSLQVNIQGTVNLLEGCRRLNEKRKTKGKEGVRVLIAGSSAEYGTTAEKFAHCRISPPLSRTPALRY